MPAQVSLLDLSKAARRARRRKKPSESLVNFETHWIDRLLSVEERLNAGTWQPSPTTCIIATKPKEREIHAPAFIDRVVHHWLVPHLEALFERRFIFHSFSNRVGKGTLCAVEWLERYVRQVHSGQGGGWYLQLDVRNFFNSIRRAQLWRTLKRAMQKAGMPLHVQQAAHALLRRSAIEQGVIHRSTPAQRALVPAHKRLENAGPGRGIAIGNYSSQFLANVVLDALDQFVKHVLKAKRYVRYVDDFVLVHHCRDQLQAWQARIERFLRDALGLELKADIRLRPMTAGIDFLGYVIFPTHRRARPRVVQHAREKLSAWAQRHIDTARRVATATPEQYQRLVSIWASYRGHFQHAATYRLQQQFHQRFPWLRQLAQTQRRFHHQLDGKPVAIPLFTP